MTVAALFVDRKGPYYGLGCDCWDEARDARLYSGPHPVVAHPPCERWGKLAPMCEKRWGTKIGDDSGCFSAALKTLGRCGGVLEHPALTLAWPTFGIPRPTGPGWQGSSPAWVCEVWQSAYGHLAAKATWLLYIGGRAPFELRWERKPGTHLIGGDRSLYRKPPMPAGQNHITPPAFAAELVRLAEWSRA